MLIVVAIFSMCFIASLKGVVKSLGWNEWPQLTYLNDNIHPVRRMAPFVCDLCKSVWLNPADTCKDYSDGTGDWLHLSLVMLIDRNQVTLRASAAHNSSKSLNMFIMSVVSTLC